MHHNTHQTHIMIVILTFQSEADNNNIMRKSSHIFVPSPAKIYTTSILLSIVGKWSDPIAFLEAYIGDGKPEQHFFCSLQVFNVSHCCSMYVK